MLSRLAQGEAAIGAGAAVRLRRALQMPAPGERPLEFLESLADPAAMVASLWALAWMVEGELSNAYLILGLVIFAMSFPGPGYLKLTPLRVVRGVAVGWVALAAPLMLFGYASHLLRYFDFYVVSHWLWLAPLTQLAASFGLRALAPWVISLQDGPRRVVVAGINEQGLALCERIGASRYCGMRVVGAFDDREPRRLGERSGPPLMGRLAELPAYVRQAHIDVIFLSLPMATQPRILRLLDELRDTTASIYFVPDLFVTDLIQGRMDSVDGLPVVAVCESPFAGINGVVKRASDVMLSLLILALISPLLLLIAAGVRLSSPGPAIFRQRRYGVDGREIVVYKFRSMTVCEDGETVEQASRQDRRITRFGAFLRRTSLDELPQFVNVLQGRMSIVGPRPHAVAHNELYRKLIKGYMVRHKVKPGITGWAQVNGLRGETETLDKMKARIDHDLDYLRNWSLRLDLMIILKTILVVFRDRNAY